MTIFYDRSGKLTATRTFTRDDTYINFVAEVKELAIDETMHIVHNTVPQFHRQLIEFSHVCLDTDLTLLKCRSPHLKSLVNAIHEMYATPKDLL